MAFSDGFLAQRCLETNVADPSPEDPNVFGLPDPDLLVRDIDPDSSIIKQISKKNIVWILYDFLFFYLQKVISKNFLWLHVLKITGVDSKIRIQKSEVWIHTTISGIRNTARNRKCVKLTALMKQHNWATTHALGHLHFPAAKPDPRRRQNRSSAALGGRDDGHAGAEALPARPAPACRLSLPSWIRHLSVQETGGVPTSRTTGGCAFRQGALEWTGEDDK